MKRIYEIGVMGGTFNPIHDKHLIVAQAAVDQFSLSELLIIPNGTPPHKKSGVLDAESRFEMAVAGAAGNPRFTVSRVEIDREGPSYTVDTLRLLRAQYAKELGLRRFRLNLIIGEDNVSQIHSWHEDGEIFKLAGRILIAPRYTVDPERERQWLSVLQTHAAEHGCTIEVGVIDCPTSSVSSTAIREWICAGRSVRYLVPPAVYEILERKGHYKQRTRSRKRCNLKGRRG